MTTPSTTPHESPITGDEIRNVMLQDRPELLEQWSHEGIAAAHLARVAANAQWLWERNQASRSRWTSTLRQTGQLRDHSISQAVWMATLDDLDNENTFDRDPDSEPLNATQLRSGWFST